MPVYVELGHTTVIRGDAGFIYAKRTAGVATWGVDDIVLHGVDRLVCAARVCNVKRPRKIAIRLTLWWCRCATWLVPLNRAL